MKTTGKLLSLLKLLAVTAMFVGGLLLLRTQASAAENEDSVFYTGQPVVLDEKTANGLNHQLYIGDEAWYYDKKDKIVTNDATVASDKPIRTLINPDKTRELAFRLILRNRTSAPIKDINEEVVLPKGAQLVDAKSSVGELGPMTQSSTPVVQTVSPGGLGLGIQYSFEQGKFRSTASPLSWINNDGTERTTWEGLLGFKMDGEIEAGGFIGLTFRLNYDKDQLNLNSSIPNQFKLISHGTSVAQNETVYEMESRFAKKVDTSSGKYLAVTRNDDGTFTLAKDIQDLMPEINANQELKYDNLDYFDGHDLTADQNVEAFASKLDTQGYTGSGYYVNVNGLKDATGKDLVAALKTKGYSLPKLTDGAQYQSYPIGGDAINPLTPTVYGSDKDKTPVSPFNKDGIGSAYLWFVKDPVDPTPEKPGGNGGSSSRPGSSGTTIKPDVTIPNPQSNTDFGAATKPSTPKLPNYAAVKSSSVYALGSIYLYKHATFAKKDRIAHYPKQKRTERPMFVVTDYARSNGGALRYKVRDVNHKSKTAGKTGYITANPKFVTKVYYQSVPKTKAIQVLGKKGINSYHNETLTKKMRHYKKGTMLKVKKIVNHNLTTRYQLTNGNYVSANKKLVYQVKK